MYTKIYITIHTRTQNVYANTIILLLPDLKICLQIPSSFENL